LNKIEIKENEKLLSSIFADIKKFYYIPPNFFQSLPKGGQGYIDMIQKYF